MPRHDGSELAIRLGREAEAVCRHYLSSGQRVGRYWLVGDVQNTPGRSMFVRLTGPASGKGAAGKWTDMATGEHGDLLDVIREALGLVDFRDVAEEARRFLALPHPEPESTRTPTGGTSCTAPGSPEASRRLFAIAQPIRGTLAEIYLSGRAITSLSGTAALRYHPRCYYRPDEHSPTEIRPAMVAAVTDLAGHQTGAHRTWLAPDGSSKAPVETPRRAMGDLLGHAVRFGTANEVLAVGEGIETVLSPRQVLPRMPMLAALSAAHLAPTRSGKGVGLVVPSLLTWPGSAIVHDIKGENWTLTAGFRAKHGRVLLFDPTNPQSAAYNPLLEVRRGEWEVRDVQNIADILVDPEGSLEKRNHWEKTSHALLVGAILHVLYAEKDKTLAGVAGFLSDPERPIEAVLAAMMATDHLGGAGRRLCRAAGPVAVAGRPGGHRLVPVS